MNTTPEAWYNRKAIKQLVVKARREGAIEYRTFKRFKIAARGEETFQEWVPVAGDPIDHPLFNLLTEARNLERKLLWATRDIPEHHKDLPEFYEKDGSRRQDSVWAMERDQEMPSVAEAIKAILDENPGVGQA